MHIALYVTGMLDLLELYFDPAFLPRLNIWRIYICLDLNSWDWADANFDTFVSRWRKKSLTSFRPGLVGTVSNIALRDFTKPDSNRARGCRRLASNNCNFDLTIPSQTWRFCAGVWRRSRARFLFSATRFIRLSIFWDLNKK